MGKYFGAVLLLGLLVLALPLVAGAAPHYDYQQLRRLPVDARIVKEISRSPKLMVEQGNSMSRYGGFSLYITFAELPTNDRLTYAAVLDGYTTADTIANMTNLKPSEVSDAAKSLAKEGLITKIISEPIVIAEPTPTPIPTPTPTPEPTPTPIEGKI